MRRRIIALGLTVVVLSGCSHRGASAAPAPSAPAPVVASTPPPPPAADAGGACMLWEYDLIERRIGVPFTVAASVRVGDTSSCVVQTEAGDYPYLTLSVVDSSRAGAAVFREEAPAKSAPVKVGKAGYRLVTKASGGHGPVVEVGWLSDAKQIQTLRFTFAAGAATADVDRMAGDLVALARTVNTT